MSSSHEGGSWPWEPKAPVRRGACYLLQVIFALRKSSVLRIALGFGSLKIT